MTLAILEKIIKGYYAYEPDSKLIRILIQLKWIMGFLGIIPQFGRVYVKRDLLNKLSQFDITKENYCDDLFVDTSIKGHEGKDNFGDIPINEFLDLKLFYLFMLLGIGICHIFWHLLWGFLPNMLVQGIYNNDWSWSHFDFGVYYYYDSLLNLNMLRSSIILIMYLVTTLPSLIYIFVLNKNIRILLKSQNKNKINLNLFYTTAKEKRIWIVYPALVILGLPIPFATKAVRSLEGLNNLKLNLQLM